MYILTRSRYIRVYRTEQHEDTSATKRAWRRRDDDGSGDEDNGKDDEDDYDDVGTTRSYAYIAGEDRTRARKRRGKKERREACEIAVQPTHTVVADRRGRQGTRASKMEGRRAWNIKGGTWIHISSGGSRCFAAERLFSRDREKATKRWTEIRWWRRVSRMKEKEGLKSREARKDCEKENERLENSRPWLLSYLSRVQRWRLNIPPIEKQRRNMVIV